MKSLKSPSPATRRIAVAAIALAVVSVVAITAWRDREQQHQATAAPPRAIESSEVADVKDSPARFDDDGRLLPPTGYRRWVYVGTPLTPNDMNGGAAPFPEFHSVYIDPDAFSHYERTGEFPDGTVVVKELVGVGTKRATSGRGYFMGDFIGLEVAVKHAARFADEPGHWAYFSFGHEYPLAKQAAAQPVANCSSCHGANADDDFVFTQYYPVLRAARAASSAEGEHDTK